MNPFNFFLSYLYSISVEKTSSVYNPVLEVSIENGKYVLNADHSNYSFGSLHTIFLKAFQKLRIGEKQMDKVLLLGFGAGSVPAMLFEEFDLNCHITAVEIDEKVIELAKKYFNIQRFKNLKLIRADAFEYVQSCNHKFDMIVVDIFIDNKVPVQFESVKFLGALKRLMNNNSQLLFNKIVQQGTKASYEKFKQNMTEVFGEYQVLNIFNNAVIVVGNRK